MAGAGLSWWPRWHAENCHGQEIFKLHEMQMLARLRRRAHSHNNPAWGHSLVSAEGPHIHHRHVSHLTTEDTWLVMTRVVSSVSHWVGARVTRVTDHTQDGLTAGYQLAMWGRDAKDSRGQELGQAARRGRSAHSGSVPAAVPGFPPDIWTIARAGAGHGSTLAVSRYL